MNNSGNGKEEISGGSAPGVGAAEEEINEWLNFKEWILENTSFKKETPHARVYAETILNSHSFRECEYKLEKLDEEFDLPVLSDFYALTDIYFSCQKEIKEVKA